MNRENLAKTITIILTTMLFIVVGSCFSAFLYKDEMIEVKDPPVYVADGMQIFNEDGDKVITTLKLSKMPLGLKPATGDEDSVTNIPSTVTDRQGSEGLYAKFKIFAPENVTIKVKNIKIQSKNQKEEVNKERDKIFVAFKELETSAVSLQEDEVNIGNIMASDERQSLTLYVWLSSKAGNALKATKISFDIYFEKIN